MPITVRSAQAERRQALALIEPSLMGMAHALVPHIIRQAGEDHSSAHTPSEPMAPLSPPPTLTSPSMIAPNDCFSIAREFGVQKIMSHRHPQPINSWKKKEICISRAPNCTASTATLTACLNIASCGPDSGVGFPHVDFMRLQHSLAAFLSSGPTGISLENLLAFDQS